VTDGQINAAAQLWRMGMDTHAIALRVFGWSHSTENGSFEPVNYEAWVYDNMDLIRAAAWRQRAGTIDAKAQR
jgi:hypothetical protein